MPKLTCVNAVGPVTNALQLGTPSSGALVLMMGEREREDFVDFVQLPYLHVAVSASLSDRNSRRRLAAPACIPKVAR